MPVKVNTEHITNLSLVFEKIKTYLKKFTDLQGYLISVLVHQCFAKMPINKHFKFKSNPN
jgi:hypothetical protein